MVYDAFLISVRLAPPPYCSRIDLGRFPLALVYRVLDIVFAEGIEAMFRFSLALLRRSEDRLLDLEFEEILAFLQSDLFEIYRLVPSDDGESVKTDEEEEWRANEFVRDAYEIQMSAGLYGSRSRLTEQNAIHARLLSE